MGMIFDIKHYAIHDGPGIRTTVFLKGCPLNCPWCHNPESKKQQPELMWTPTKCLSCQSCVESCPEDALILNGGLYLDEVFCSVCGKCAEACYPEALKLVGQNMTVSEVIAEIEKDYVFHEESNGGVTFSGGEPLYQPKFINELLAECKKKNIHTALDTCGYADPRLLLDIIGFVDLWLYDIKHMDSKKHKETIGVSNQLILENLRMLKGENVIIRLPLIPGFNDDLLNIKATGCFLQKNNFKNICILPYHSGGIAKQERLITTDIQLIIEPPNDNIVKQVAELLEEYGLNVKIGG